MDKSEISLKLDELLAGFENEVVEIKEAKSAFDFDDLGKYFSALSNEANLKNVTDAWLIFGVRDNGKILVGTQYKNGLQHLNQLKEQMTNHTSNRITFIEIYQVIRDGHRILLFQIPAGPKGIPIGWKGHFYGRDGESLGALNISEIERIRKQNIFSDWSKGICPDANISDLDPDAILDARMRFVDKNTHLASEVSSWDDTTFLNKAKLCINGSVTKTAILLLGKGESEHFLSPGSSKITWILKDRDNVEKDYQHFGCPLLLNVQKVFEKIRISKYRYIKDGTVFPEEVDQYDPYLIRESLHNCIAHQDYQMGGKIIVIENEDGFLVFQNSGSFIPESIENVVYTDAPENYYRNKFLVDAMVNVNMIDTIGSGIKNMFYIQKSKYFPLPDYDIDGSKVKLTITGKIIDINYARKLTQIPDIRLQEIIMLDKVQKKKALSTAEVKFLKSKNYIEGRKPDFYISVQIAERTDQKHEYIQNRGFQDDHYKKLILEYLDKYKSASKEDITKLIYGLLPKILDHEKKMNKIRNILYSMSKKDKSILNIGTNKRDSTWTKV